MLLENHITRLREELEMYYSTYDPMEEDLFFRLKKELEAYPDEISYAHKSRMHEFLCEICPVKIFRHTSLFFEMVSGRKRFTWGGLQSGVGGFLHLITSRSWLKPYEKALENDREEGFMYGWDNPVGFDNHCAGYDNLLALGLNGIIAKHSGQDIKKVQKDTDRDFFMSAEEAVKYHLVDKVLNSSESGK
jgi:hypothetical protein